MIAYLEDVECLGECADILVHGEHQRRAALVVLVVTHVDARVRIRLTSPDNKHQINAI